MSPTSIGFVFLLGILHVCSGKSVIQQWSVTRGLSFELYKLNLERKKRKVREENFQFISLIICEAAVIQQDFSAFKIFQ